MVSIRPSKNLADGEPWGMVVAGSFRSMFAQELRKGHPAWQATRAQSKRHVDRAPALARRGSYFAGMNARPAARAGVMCVSPSQDAGDGELWLFLGGLSHALNVRPSRRESTTYYQPGIT